MIAIVIHVKQNIFSWFRILFACVHCDAKTGFRIKHAVGRWVCWLQCTLVFCAMSASRVYEYTTDCVVVQKMQRLKDTDLQRRVDNSDGYQKISSHNNKLDSIRGFHVIQLEWEI